jgi:hypothetical protein
MVIMLHQEKRIFQTKILVLSLIAISLAACSNGTDTSNSSTDSVQTSTPINSPPTSEPTVSTSVTIPGVKNITEVKFNTTNNSSNGVFDTINGSTTPTTQVSRETPITATGWAVIPDEKRIADRVIITYGDNNSLVAVVPVNLKRPDVEKALNNPAYSNSGWNATFDSSALPTDKVVLKAWAYNSASQEATQLSSTREIVFK